MAKIDFIIKDGETITEAIQVCHTINDANRKREIDGLVEAAIEFNLRKGLILTYEQEEEITVDNIEITIMPVLKWILKEHNESKEG